MTTTSECMEILREFGDLQQSFVGKRLDVKLSPLS
jgi:hypothetical protein